MTSLPRFPVYLLPSMSFDRRKSGPKLSKPEIHDEYAEVRESHSLNNYLRGHSSHLQCARCATDLCSTSQIISKGFTGRHGRAYLISPTSSLSTFAYSPKVAKSFSLPNTHVHKSVSRQLVTGAHTVSDVSCAFCGSILGWKYDGAEEESQRYKVGKFILETKKICSSSCWQNDGWDEQDQSGFLNDHSRGPESGASDCERNVHVEFDSQDEDECEDLFSGSWSPGLASRRRQARKFEKAFTGFPIMP